ncbi:MAG: peptide chain release factor N(5)-glutamine methyltransferase [bacterium]
MKDFFTLEMTITTFSLLNSATSYLEKNHIESPRLTAELLLAFACKTDRGGLFLRLRDVLPEKSLEIFRTLLHKRSSHEPLQYLLGKQEFWSSDFEVDNDVLIPRPETELLVEKTLSIINNNYNPLPHPIIWDIGTGSGNIIISLAKELGERCRYVASDISQLALKKAENNAQRNNVADLIGFLHGDMFSPLKEEKRKVDIIVSNPPYIRSCDILTLQEEIKQHEPIIALDGGLDGLKFYKLILEEAYLFLRPRGNLLLEIGSDQAEDVLGLLLRNNNYRLVEVLRDYACKDRVVWIEMGI